MIQAPCGCQQRRPFTCGQYNTSSFVHKSSSSDTAITLANLCRLRHSTRHPTGHRTRQTAAAAGSDDGICPCKSGLAVQLGGQFAPPKLTKSDEAFAADGLEFVYSHEGIDLDELNDLFGKVGFPRRDPEKLAHALENTHVVLWARATKQSRWARRGQLLGFARATSDRALFGTIWDVAVNPAWQRVGIGRGAVERLMIMLLEEDVASINLYAEPSVVSLYERLGFQKDVENTQGMSFQQRSTIGKAVMASL